MEKGELFFSPDVTDFLGSGLRLIRPTSGVSNSGLLHVKHGLGVVGSLLDRARDPEKGWVERTKPRPTALSGKKRVRDQEGVSIRPAGRLGACGAEGVLGVGWGERGQRRAGRRCQAIRLSRDPLL